MINLEANSTGLEEILAMVNALPEETPLPSLTNPAGESDIYTGKEAIDQTGAKLTGTNPYNAANVDPAVSNALAALAEKGVSVSGSEGIADLATLIAAIEAGGGSSDSAAGGVIGQIKPTELNDFLHIEHNLGVAPRGWLVADKYGKGSKRNNLGFVVFLRLTETTSSITKILASLSSDGASTNSMTTGGSRITYTLDDDGHMSAADISDYGLFVKANKKYIAVPVVDVASENSQGIVLNRTYYWAVW